MYGVPEGDKDVVKPILLNLDFSNDFTQRALPITRVPRFSELQYEILNLGARISAPFRLAVHGKVAVTQRSD